MRLRRCGRGWCGAGAALLLLLSTAGEARAVGLPGVPQIVFDPAAVGKLVTQVSRQYQQLRIAEETRNHLRAEARRFSRLPLVSFATRQLGYGRLFAGDNLLGYNNPRLDRVFEAAFPQSRLAERLGSLPAQQHELVRRAAHALVMGARQQGAQLREAEVVLAQARAYASGAASEAQVAQSQAALSALAVEEQQQARQLQIAENNQRAVMDAYRVSRDMREDSLAAASAADLAGRDRHAAGTVDRYRDAQRVSSDVWRPERAVDRAGRRPR